MPFAGNRFDGKLRFALLAGTTLASAVLAQPTLAGDALPSAERTFLLAQANPAVDPQTGRPLPKGAQQPGKGAAPKASQSGPGTPLPGAPPRQLGQPPQGAQPRQVGQPPRGTESPQDAQPRQFGRPPQGGRPGQVGQQPQGTEPPPGAQPRQFGRPPQGGRPGQVGQQPQGTESPQDAQPRQFGRPPQGGRPGQVGQQPQGTESPQDAQPRQFGRPPQGGRPGQVGQQPQGTEPPPGTQPRQFGRPPQGAQPQQVGQPPQPGLPQGGAPGIPQQQTGRPQLPAGAPPQSLPPQAAPTAAHPTGYHPGAGAQPGWRGNVDQLRSQRRERHDGGGRLVIEEPGRRIIVREGNTTIIRNDDNERFRRWGSSRFEQRGHEHYSYITRPGGYQIINITDGDGRLLRRMRRGPDGREIILIDNRRGPGFGAGLAVGAGVGLAAGVMLGLAAPVVTIPRERYIVDVSAAPRPLLYETLEAPPVMAMERPYSLDEIRYNVELRDRMRRVDIDSITFDSGSWEVSPEQYGQLEAIADAMRRVLEGKPDEVFLIEGHTDAVGADVDNLSLSDRRAESVAVILTDVYQIPPENLVTQGYGEQHPKVPTVGPSRENRRVSVRRITPLLNGAVASR